MKTIHSILIATSLLAAACSEETPEPYRHLHPAPEPEPSTTRTVQGLEMARFVTIDGTLLDEAAMPFHDTLFEAHVPDGEGYTILPGFGRRDGTFEIPDVPKGDYWLRISRRPAGDDYIWTDSDVVDFTSESLGPFEDVRGELGTKLSFTVDGLDAWQEGDTISFFGPNHVIFGNDFSMAAEGLPATGATSVEGMTVDWVGRPLVTLAEDEHNLVIQHRTAENDQGVPYRAPIRSFTPAPMTIADATVSEINGTFSTPPVLEYRLTWNLAAFEELRGAIHPTAAGASTLRGTGLFSAALAGEEILGWSPEYPLFQLMDPSVLEGNELVDLGTFSIPNPYPAEWVLAHYSVVFPVALPFPGGMEVSPLEGVLAVRTRHLPTADEPMAPRLVPVSSVKLDGQEADGGLTDVSPMPVLSFEAPTLGAPNVYLVQVIEAIPAPPEPYRPGWYMVANLWLPGDVTEIRLPEDVLRPGGTYTILIRAIDEPGKDLRHKPGLMGVESAVADHYTGVFTVKAE